MSAVPVSSFSTLGLPAPLLQAVEAAGYQTPSPIQVTAIPVLLAGRDLLGQAQTGTGKTAAFALPLLGRIDLDLKHPQMLVLAPTRELAMQVCEAMRQYAVNLPGFQVLPIYGGQGMREQLEALSRGVHAVVGTPGRVMDHLRRGTLRLDRIQSVVLDEADEMLRMGFVEDVEWILEHAPAERQVALFSATMPQQVRAVARRQMREPEEVRIEAKTTTGDTIRQRYLEVGGGHKLEAFTRMLEIEPFDAMIVFARTKGATVELAEALEGRGYSAAALNGDMNQVQREQTVDRLKRGTLDIVVATDVAARGLDVERISHVVNYDIPTDPEAYVHRIGRTGRAGRSGEALLLVTPRERRLLRNIERSTRQPIEAMPLPTAEAITERRVQRFKQLIGETLAGQELGFFEELVQQYAGEQELEPARVAAALAYLVQRERPLNENLHRIPLPTAGRRDEREDRGRREAPRRTARSAPTGEMERFRIEVGREHGVEPRHIVGAIANEAGIDSRNIGAIRLYPEHSTVELPQGLPRELYSHLRGVWVCGRRLDLSPLGRERQGPPAGRRHTDAAVRERGRAPGKRQNKRFG